MPILTKLSLGSYTQNGSAAQRIQTSQQHSCSFLAGTASVPLVINSSLTVAYSIKIRHSAQYYSCNMASP